PAQVNCTWNGNTNDVINGINNGAFMLVHRGTGSEQGWGEPDFSNNDINALNNTNLTFIWSIDCLTGKFNLSGECFAEKFHRHTSGGNNAGALGIVAASEISYSLVSDVYAWGAFDNMWPDFMPDVITTPESKGVLPAFANVAGKYFLYQSSWPYNTANKIVIYNIFHYFGDAFSTVYYEMPQELDVSHPAWVLVGTTVFEVTANEGSLIALSVNGVLIGTGDGTGAPVLIQIPPQNPPDEILVTVTKQNYYRYEAWVPVGTGTGLMDNTAQDYINVYPNPVTDNLLIKLTKNMGTTYITISNLLSELVYENKIEVGEEKTLNINLSGYRGVYFIRIKTAKIDHAKKIIVQ
ncbi:MAG: T9SS type A sorting domain-containing protein, partial [Bacteroidetes bacterium]|nr:T9SS type A sorting domain-containing protein [Bacteroidota bacterium]